MALAAARRPDPADPPGTVIVLGCEARPDGRPSVMLQSRINAACAYLTAHPEAVCVASGGKDDAETITEAECIRTTLVSMGIDPGRIYLEDRSGSTYENLTFSAALIADRGLDDRVAIATDNFHEYRGQFFARRAGLTPCSLGCASYPLLGPGYWARECWPPGSGDIEKKPPLRITQSQRRSLYAVFRSSALRRSQRWLG